MNDIWTWLLPWKAKKRIETQQEVIAQLQRQYEVTNGTLEAFRSSVDHDGKVTEEALNRLAKQASELKTKCEEQAHDLAEKDKQIESIRGSMTAWQLGAEAVEKQKNIEIEKLKARLEESHDQVKKHKRALATTALWIRTAHRVDVPAADNTIRKAIMETT